MEARELLLAGCTPTSNVITPSSLNSALAGLGLTARHFAVMLLMDRDGVRGRSTGVHPRVHEGEKAFDEAVDYTQALVDSFFTPLAPDEIELFEDMLSRLIVTPRPTLNI